MHIHSRTASIVVTVLLICGPVGAWAEESSDAPAKEPPKVVTKVAKAVKRGASAVATGIEHGAKAVARGVEKGAKATERAAHRVVSGKEHSAASAPAAQ